MTRRGTTQAYRHLDASLLRASAHLADVVPRAWPDIHDDAKLEAWCGWLVEVWAQETVRDAVTVASPALAERVRAVCDGSRPDADRVQRLMLTVARYLARMRGRATPFGLFAGVAPLRFGEHASVRWGPENRVRVQADSAWIAAAITRLESCHGVRRLLTVLVNDKSSHAAIVLFWAKGSATHLRRDLHLYGRLPPLPGRPTSPISPGPGPLLSQKSSGDILSWRRSCTISSLV